MMAAWVSGTWRRAVLTAAVAGIAMAAPLAAADGARALLDRVKQLNQTTRKWSDRVQRMNLTITDRRGNEARRDLEVLTKRYGEDASRSIMFFHAPPQVQGIGFLQWIAPQEPDRQWLYLPALKRTRQISGGTRTESFAGTDFSYEDLSIMADVVDWRDDKAHVTLAGEETVDGHASDIVALTPTAAAEVSYGTIRLWLGRDDQVVRKYEFVDAQGTLAKTLLLSDIRDVGGIPAAYRLEMRNQRTGSHTLVELSELKYNAGLDDEVFTQRRLEKGAS
jgi:outer membrane lipoprotein-sorting protein